MTEQLITLRRKAAPFTMVNNQVILDSRLSMKAKGIMSYMLSRPTGWQFYSSEIGKHSRDGRESIQAGLKELERFGYLKRTRVKDEKGRFVRIEWFVDDNPEEEPRCPQTGNPSDGISGYGFPAAGKPAATNTDNNNTEKEEDASGVQGRNAAILQSRLKLDKEMALWVANVCRDDETVRQLVSQIENATHPIRDVKSYLQTVLSNSNRENFISNIRKGWLVHERLEDKQPRKTRN